MTTQGPRWPDDDESSDGQWEGYGVYDEPRRAAEYPPPAGRSEVPPPQPGGGIPPTLAAEYPSPHRTVPAPTPGPAPQRPPSPEVRGASVLGGGYDQGGEGYDQDGYGGGALDPGYDDYDASSGDYYGADQGGYGDAAYGGGLSDSPPYGGVAGVPEPESPGRRTRKEARRRGRAMEREARWEKYRFAVPYRTDGPKLTFGVAWFVLLMGAVVTSPVLVALLAATVAGMAGLQTGYAWYPRHQPTRWWAAAGAFVAGMAGVVGGIGLVIAIVLGVAVSAAYAVGNPSRSQSTGSLMEVAARSIIPVGVAAASLSALTAIGTGAAIALVVLVSAYEAGDFIVGSGASNPVEGPVSGLIALGAVVFILWVVTPSPFSSSSIVVFGALAGVCCPLGQIAASAILPRGSSWAPALRRLDSYLLVTPLWVVLVGSLPTTATL